MEKYNDLNNMMCLDLFLTSLSRADYQKLLPHLQSKQVFPIRSWDLPGNGIHQFISSDRQKLEAYHRQYKWKLNLTQALEEEYDALILTNSRQEIVWANDGFTDMTGYSVHSIIGKKPGMLHGPNTSEESKQRIRKKLEMQVPFKDVIINYKKNQEEYVCEIRVIPIFNHQQEVTHFLALERVV